MTGITVAKALHWAKQKLPKACSRDADWLLQHVLQISAAQLLLRATTSISATEWQSYQAVVTRREKGEPFAYIVGQREFWSLNLTVNAHTLIPRPETELLVDVVLALYPDQTPKTVIDLGTGAGPIILALATERPAWQLYATDISAKALGVAKANANELGIQTIQWLQTSWFNNLLQQKFDVVISNPPYIAKLDTDVQPDVNAFEPHQALYSGTDGLDDLCHLIQEAPNYLKPAGYLCLEHGFKQAAALRELCLQAGFASVTCYQDLAGLDRVTVAQLPKCSDN